MKEWVKMPSKQFMDTQLTPLTKMRWKASGGNADMIAALMIYIALVHHANESDSRTHGPVGSVKITYDVLCQVIGISRNKLSGGLKVLQVFDLVSREGEGKNVLYRITGYTSPSGWAKLPAKGLYDDSRSQIKVFKDFKLRNKAELNALKIYLVLLSFRNNKTLMTLMSYEKIAEYAGVQRSDIRTALSFLVVNHFITINTDLTHKDDYSRSNQYRIRHLEANKKPTELDTFDYAKG
jgi:DNA-binding transcriptional ArsR family regulator